MNKILIPERWEKIIEMVEVRDGASVEEIAGMLAISPATVRRDLDRIQQRGLIERTHGGAAPSQHRSLGLTLAESRRINPAEKEIVGRAAAELIEPDDTLMFDGGFTTFQAARNIRAQGVRVITNSFDVAQAVLGQRDVKLVLLGGELLPASGTTVGPTVVAQAGNLNADKAFVGANAFSVEGGLSSNDQLTAQTKRAMIERSREVIVVADHTKLGRAELYHVAPISAITTLVTDDKADEGVLDAFREAGLEVVVASGE